MEGKAELCDICHEITLDLQAILRYAVNIDSITTRKHGDYYPPQAVLMKRSPS
jgi:hypothetical protein